MGMFDYVKCKYKLPWEGVQGLEWQSKTTPSQCCDTYEVREDGTLWLLCFDLVPGERKPAWMPQVHRTNERWKQQKDFTGAIEIYSGDYAVHFWFRDGQVQDAVYFKDGKEV